MESLKNNSDNEDSDDRSKNSSISFFFKHLLKDTSKTSIELFKITIPVIILTKILEELGVIKYLSIFLEPLMQVIGLPGELGLVWATGMLTNLYGAMVVFASLAPGLDLTVCQVTVIGSVLLIAHSLPVELSVSKKAGAPFWPIAMLRLIGAVVYGVLLDSVCRFFGFWQQEAVILFKAAQKTSSLPEWVWGQTINLFIIVAVIFAIIVGMHILRFIGVLGLLEKMLNPVLPFFGMSKNAAPITVVGMVMGIGYGGALIIRETQLGKLTKKEIFNSMALMALCHGLIEDTLLMVALGGKLGGLLFGRIVFALIVTFLIVKVMNRKQSN